MEKVRIGFVGVGLRGQMAHLANYVNVEGCEVVALAEVRPELGRKVAARYGVAKVYPDHKAMLASEALDGIVAPGKDGLYLFRNLGVAEGKGA